MTSANFKKFISGLKSVSLSAEEKNSLRSDFLKRTGMEHATSPMHSRYLLLFRYVKIVAYSFALFIVGIAPIAFAAESSHPGDILYSFKEAVNLPLKKQVDTIIDTVKNGTPHTTPNPQSSGDSKLEPLSKKDEEAKTDKKIKKETPDKIKKSIPQYNAPAFPTSTKVIDKEIKDKLKEIDSTHKKSEKEIESTIDELEDIKDKAKKEVEKKSEDAKETKKEIENEIENTTESTINKVIKNIDLSL